MKLLFTESARDQLLHIIAYIRADSLTAARRLRDRVEGTLRRLETFPESGRRIPELPEIPYRELILKPYRFFYRVEADIVWMLAVWHGAQLPNDPSP